MRRRRALGFALGGALALPVGVALGVRGAARPRIRSAAQLQDQPVAVVLGAQSHPGGRPSTFLRGRLEVAARLYLGDGVRHVLVSGDGSASSHHEPQAMRDWLVRAGVPSDQITVDAHGYDTYDSCWRARHVYGHRQVVVVSQTYHLPRTLLTCRLLGLDAIGVGDDSVRDTRTWREGVLREQVALVKLGWDVAIRRRPTTSRAED